MRRELHPPHVGAGHVHLHGHRQLVLAGPQRAGAVGQRLGQHRLHRAGHVGAGAAAVGLGVDRAAGAHVGGHVGDVHPQPHEAVALLGGDRVVEVLGVVGVDRERGQVAQVRARGVDLDLGVGGLGLHLARERAAQAAVEHQRLDHVARHLRAADLADHPRAALAGADEHDVALASRRGRRG